MPCSIQMKTGSFLLADGVMGAGAVPHVVVHGVGIVTRLRGYDPEVAMPSDVLNEALSPRHFPCSIPDQSDGQFGYTGAESTLARW